MAATVTPMRRRRDDSNDDDVSITSDSTSPTNSASSKRPRLQETRHDGLSDTSPSSQDGPLLPDSYRHSPRNRRTIDASTTGKADSVRTQTHQPGSILRVTLTNFVTYTNAEFLPGPNLNMVIGPNGTGKSTLVCAICLGLAWSTSHLGRAKEIGEFVKHGAGRAEIEIELAADPARHTANPVITTRIMRDNKTSFSINGTSASKKGVQELARSFSIQVDNLCQFLPQDRVVEFAALSSIDLLAHTQRAAAPDYMTEWHEELKVKRKEEKQAQEQQQSLVEALGSLEARQRAQESEVNRLRERSELQSRAAALEKLRPLAEYNAAKDAFLQAKSRKKEFQAELRRLERQVEPNMRAVNDKEQYVERIEKARTSRHRILEKLEAEARSKRERFNSTKESMESIMKEIDTENDGIKGAKQAMARHQQDIARLQRLKENPPTPCDFGMMNLKIRETKAQIRSAENEISELREQITSLQEQVRQRKVIVERASQEKAALQSESGRQTSKLEKVSRDTSTAWRWVQSNRDKFQSDVFGPAMIECTVKNPRYVDAVESALSKSELTAITVTSQADFQLLSEQLYRQMKLKDINLRSSLQPLSSFRPPCSADQLQGLGLESWLLDLLEGPEAVLAMLCDNRNVHQTGFTSRDISGSQHNALSRSSISSWITPNQIYVISRRREYGDAGVSTRVNPLRKAQLLTDTPVDLQVEQELSRRITETQGETMELIQQGKDVDAQIQQLEHNKSELAQERGNLEEEKDQKQRIIAEFNGLDTRIETAERKLADACEKVEASRQRQLDIHSQIDKLCLEKGQQAIDFARSLDPLREHHVLLLEAEIVMIEAKSDVENLKAQNEEESRMIEDKRRELDEATSTSANALSRARALEQTMQQLGADMTPYENEVFEEINGWHPDRLETELQSVSAQLDMLHGGNENTIRDFEQRAARIEEKRERLSEIDSQLQHLSSAIAGVRQRWEPELDQLVNQISEAFSENFSRIQCAGEVAVHKDEDFEKWAIQIKVKFRQTEQLSVLDSHRQSGGERAVSTIFYLMALQSLARAPFRVVDEINQGMDPRNERLVHSRMVDIACAEHTSQYFLITPKLLSGLKYHPNMKVHCIASGERMPEDYRELDFDTLAHKALAVRAARSAAASG